MTKKDFQMIATTIAGTRAYGLSAADQKAVALAFSIRLKERNPRFDVARFHLACDVRD